MKCADGILDSGDKKRGEMMNRYTRKVTAAIAAMEEMLSCDMTAEILSPASITFLVLIRG